MASPDDVRRVLPDHDVESVVLLGSGLENVAYEVNGELVVRFARDPLGVEREARLLAFLGPVSPLPVGWWMTSYGATPRAAIFVVSHSHPLSTHANIASSQERGLLLLSKPRRSRLPLIVWTRDPIGPGSA